MNVMIEPSLLDQGSIQPLIRSVESAVREYGPTVLINYLLKEGTSRLGKENECELVNMLQQGRTQEAVEFIQKHDKEHGTNLTKEVQKVCQELQDRSGKAQVDLSEFE